MKNQKQKVMINPSYDTNLPIERRLYDFLGKYHIILNGVLTHEQDGECCQDHKKEIVEFVVNHLLSSQRRELIAEMEKRKKMEWTLGANENHPRNNYILGYNQAIQDVCAALRGREGKEKV